MKKIEIYSRALELGRYVVDKKCTVREAARVHNISKSTVHKDITTVLNEQNPFLAEQVREVLNQNLEERNIRGGEATKKKYLKMKKNQ